MKTERCPTCKRKATRSTDANRRLCTVAFGSRTRWLSMQDDNFGFWRWCNEHTDELLTLGPGTHFGEWWGSEIQRGYGLTKGEKRFSLFNTSRWSDDATRPACCHCVPVLYAGMFDQGAIMTALHALEANGSVASPGFMKPEGVIVWHTAARIYFKKTIFKDEEWKGKP